MKKSKISHCIAALIVVLFLISACFQAALARGHGGHGHSHAHSHRASSHAHHAAVGRRGHRDVRRGGYNAGWATGPGGYGYRTWNGTKWVWDYNRRRS